MHQYSTNKLPVSFQGMFTLLRDTEERNTRDDFYNYKVNTPINNSLICFPRVLFPPVWNSLSSLYQSTESHKVFKKDLRKDILSKYEEFVSCENILCEECRANLN